MAKETKAAAAKTSSIMDMINDLEGSTVSENLAAANTMEAEVREMAETKMKEEEKKEKADQLIRITKRAVYTNIRLKIEAKYQNDTSKVMAEARNKSLELLKDLKEGKVTPTQYDDKLNELINEQIKNVEKAGKERRTNLQELESSYVGGGYYSYSWNNPFSKINRAIENNKN